MDPDEAKELAEDYFDDHEIEVDGSAVSLSLASASTDGESLFLKFAVDADEFDDGEISKRGMDAVSTALEQFRAEYPEIEDLAIELDYVAAR